MQDIKPYLEKAEQYHGHICSGQILGIRMTLMALEALGMSPHDDMRDLVIFLETDRCVADASYVVTGVTVGRRRVKMYSYGKTAMSFLDLKTGKAVRVSVITSDRPPHHADKAAQLTFCEHHHARRRPARPARAHCNLLRLRRRCAGLQRSCARWQNILPGMPQRRILQSAWGQPCITAGFCMTN